MPPNDALNIRLPISVHKALIKEAKAEGVSLNQLCVSKLTLTLSRGALLPLATEVILSDPDLMDQLQRSKEDVAAGRVTDAKDLPESP
jgi:hypothetical protein